MSSVVKYVEALLRTCNDNGSNDKILLSLRYIGSKYKTVNYPINGYSPLCYAFHHGNVELSRAMLKELDPYYTRDNKYPIMVLFNNVIEGRYQMQTDQILMILHQVGYKVLIVSEYLYNKLLEKYHDIEYPYTKSVVKNILENKLYYTNIGTLDLD